MANLKWEETEAIREALYHSRLDHESVNPVHTGSLQRISEAERELGRLLGLEGEWSYIAPKDRKRPSSESF